MEVKQETNGFAIYAPNWLKPKGAIHASFVDGECRCTATFFDEANAIPDLTDVTFAEAWEALERGLALGRFSRQEQGGGC